MTTPDRLAQDNQRLTTYVTQLRTLVDRTKAERDNLRDQFTDMYNANETLKKENDTYYARLKALEEENAELKTQNYSLKRLANHQHQELASFHNDYSAYLETERLVPLGTWPITRDAIRTCRNAVLFTLSKGRLTAVGPDTMRELDQAIYKIDQAQRTKEPPSERAT